MTETSTNYTIIDRPGTPPEEADIPPPPLEHETLEVGELILEKDIPVRMRDGVCIRIDVYRPREHSGELAVLLGWGPFGKHNTKKQWPEAGIEEGWISKLTGFEAPDPTYWCPRGYAIAYADPRGLWNSEGEFRHNGPSEARDIYDTIQWLGDADWSNGCVGMLGVSYLAGAQFVVGASKPPALKAISPWECFTDWYREFAYHGGIPESRFKSGASRNLSYSRTRTEHTAANVVAHPLMSDYYRDKYPALEDIDVPAYVVASWSDQGFHSRGTLEAFARLGSTEKWLEVHGQKKWQYFYKPDSVERQRIFFDYYLLGRGPGLNDWPRVRVEVRECLDRYTYRTDIPWPVNEQHSSRLYLDFSQSSLSSEPVEETSLSLNSQEEQVTLYHTFDRDTDVIGPMRLRLWLETEATDDADVFVSIRKFTAGGTEVRFPFAAFFEDGPVALGWLRASHRALDDLASSELRPVHPHEYEEPMTPGEPEPLDIEIWPSGTRFFKGERLAITILGRDFIQRPEEMNLPVLVHDQTRNVGHWRLYGGGDKASYLSLPVLLAQSAD